MGKSLSQFPESGRIVPEIDDPEIRERFVYSYRVIYRVETDRLLIVAVVHGRRLLRAVEGRFESRGSN